MEAAQDAQGYLTAMMSVAGKKEQVVRPCIPTYEFVSNNDDKITITEFETAGAADCSTEDDDAPCPECMAKGATDNATTVRVLFGYSEQFKAHFWNSNSLLNAYFAAEIGRANHIHEMSDSPVRLELAGTRETEYDEGFVLSRDGDLTTQMASLFEGDSELGILHVERDRLQADVVALYIEGVIGSSSGVANGIGVPDEKAFVVVRPFPRFNSSIILAHEIGHLAGLNHFGTASGITEYARGFAFGPLSIVTGWSVLQTVMHDTSGASWAISRFSNPNQSFWACQLATRRPPTQCVA